MIRSRALLLATTLLGACGGTPPASGPAVPPAPSPASSASAAPAAPAASGAASAAPAASAPHQDDKPPFDGADPGKTVKLTGPKAWVLTSNGIGLYDFVKSAGTKAVFKGFGGEGEFTSPQAFTLQTPADQKVKKGAVVLITVVTAVECGRVTDVQGDKAKVAFEWAGKVDTREEPPNELLVLDGKLGFAAPILFKETDDAESWQDGMLVYQDGKDAWLASGSKVAVKNVRPMDVLKERKPGDKVLARESGMFSLVPATIKKVLDGGVRYEVDFDGKPGVAPMCNVASIPK